jgi:replicative DNA helicase
MQASIGRLFVASLVEECDVAQLLKFGQVKDMLNPNELELYQFVFEFTKMHGKIPEAATMQAHLGEELPDAPEPVSYYYDLLQTRHIEIELKRYLKKAADLLGTSGKDPEGALEVVTEVVTRLRSSSMRSQVTDFRDAYDLILPDYVSKYSIDGGGGLNLGWPSFDTMSGGLVQGDMVSFVGRPASGKTFQMLYCAHHGWKTQDACPMFVSMEMKPLPIQQRLTGMEAGVSAWGVKNAALTSKALAKMKGALTEIKTAKAAFWVVDGNLASTVDDVYMLARMLKPDSIWIDGAYLCKHPSERDRFRRVAENVELMKQQLAALCPTVTSWQFAKSGSKKNKKKGEKADLDDIGYTDAIAQVSSIVLGLLQHDSVETIKSRLVDVLKGRSGEVGQFKTRWNFDVCDFSEIIEEDVEELKFL